MTVVSRVATLKLDNGLGSSRTWQATAAVQDTAAGQSVVITTTAASAGAAPPVTETALTLSLYTDMGALVRAFTLTPGSASQTSTFFFTNDGTNTGTNRAGTLEVALRATQSAGLAATQYDYETDGSPSTLPTGFTATQVDRGWIRGTTTAATVLSGAGMLAYGDTLTATTTLGAAPFNSKTLSVALSPVTATASAASTTVTFTTALGTVDNRFPASSASRTTAVTVPTSALSGAAWTTATLTETTRTVDPRLTFTHLHQDNDATFGTPPMSKDVGAQRLTSDLAFLAARVSNANAAGVNGLTWTATLADAGGLVAALSHTPTSSTRGGEAGWGAFLTWDSTLPGGTWTKSCTITAPAGATGLDTNSTFDYSLVASDPNLHIIGGFGPTPTDEGTHFVAGMDVGVGGSILNTATGVMLAADAGTAAAAVGRQEAATGRVQYLDAAFAWQYADTGVTYFHPLAETFPGSKLYVTQFTAAQTAGWGAGDLAALIRAEVGGVPISIAVTMSNVAGLHRHDVAGTLDSLSDVATAGEASGMSLTFNGTTWVPEVVSVQPADIAAIADAVWDETTAEARVAGSYGMLVKTDLDATVSSLATAASVTALGSPAQASVLATDYAALLAAIGTPAQAAALAALVTTVGSPAQAAVLAADYAALLAAIEADPPTVFVEVS